MCSALKDFAAAGHPPAHFPIIDIHSHIGGWRAWDSVTPEQRIAMMDRTGIRISVTSSLRALAGDIARGNDEVLEVIRRFPGRFFGYAHVSANYPDSLQSELERCFRNPGMRGIKVYQNGIPFDDARFTPVWDFAEAHNIPILAHTWAGVLTSFDTIALAYPSVNFLIAHAGSDFTYQTYCDFAKKVPNFYLDLTYSREHTNMIEHFVATVGAQRIVWGTDEPLFAMSHQLAKVLFARISDDDKIAILSRNSARLFGFTGEEG